MPLDPVYTSMTLGLEGSMVIMRSALSATSAGLSTICRQKHSEVKTMHKQVRSIKKKKKRFVYTNYLSTQLLYFLAGLRKYICGNYWVSML